MLSKAGSNIVKIPKVGMLAIVRRRRGVINEVREFDGDSGRFHIVHLDYKDDMRPTNEEVIWELELSKELLEPSVLPQSQNNPMSVEDFDALLLAARWSAITPYLDPDAEGPLDRLPVSSPFHAAVELDDYQLVPLLKALRMPRVNLMIADDVGLGKTIEAGLILSELLIRRRINRVLILTPASLRIQWRDEMWSKFSLPFDVIDHDSTLKLKRRLGIDANPWRCCSRIIASYHYLRQPDVLDQFMSVCRTPENSPHLPWDLLIVDEVHNLMPASFGDDSQLCEMLRLLAPQFEHRLFLTATPHNGYTRSFTGLLELLDPVRFSRTDELRPAEKERVKQIVLRRLKREINERTNPPKFCTRKPPCAIKLDSVISKQELALINAFEKFRTKVRSIISSASKKRQLAGTFAIEILGKRLLSGPMTFLESWHRCKMGLQEQDTVDDNDVIATAKVVQEETADDLEAQKRESTAANVIGSWMKAIADDVEREIETIDIAASGLSVSLDTPIIEQNPSADARFDALVNHIQQLLMDKGKWKADERLIIFTEYKTTLDYLLRRLREYYSKQEDRFLCLFGGMDDIEREQIKDAFNDPEAKVRVLIATDAASEGLNLQSTARYILHYDCPWNPAKLEQRNGRLDRHGQARDVHVFHFASEQASDLKFMSYLIGKVDQIREDLGAIGELFDEATHRRMIRGEDVAQVQKSLDIQIDQAIKAVKIDADNTIEQNPFTGESDLEQQIETLSQELDLDASTARNTLETAMAIGVGRPQLTQSDELDRFEIINPGLSGWKEIVDETVRKRTDGKTLGPVPKLSFSAKPFMQTIAGRQIFRPRIDTLMLHLGHPLVQKAKSSLARRRFPGPSEVSRWTVKYGNVPAGSDALILLHLEEFAVNQLRETFHHWLRTICIPVKGDKLIEPLPHQPAMRLRGAQQCIEKKVVEKARELLSDFEPDLQGIVKDLCEKLTKNLQKQLAEDGETAKQEEDKRYRSRQAEVSTLIADNTLAKLERTVKQLKQQRSQGVLFENQLNIEELDRSIELKQEELQRRTRHYEEIREQLTRERERIIKFLLPKRYSMQESAQIFPVSVEIRLPMPKGGAR